MSVSVRVKVRVQVSVSVRAQVRAQCFVAGAGGVLGLGTHRTGLSAAQATRRPRAVEPPAVEAPAVEAPASPIQLLLARPAAMLEQPV